MYYAEHHDVPIDPRFVTHARARDFVTGEVPESAIEDALDALDDLDDGQSDGATAQAVTPYEWCQRYARGELSQERLIDILVNYDYTPRIRDREWNDIIEQPPGTFAEVERAATNSLIDPDLYEIVFTHFTTG